MATKSESLSFPADPLAALRALQDLDAPAAPPREPPRPVPEEGEPGPPAARATGGEGGGAARSAAAKRPAARRGRGAPGDEAKRPGDESDPLGDAVRELLARPYAGEGSKVPVTVSTVKIPTEVWERLGWVAAITGRTKQDLIAEALKGYFRVVLEGG
jgi:hypothetical protein